MKKLILKKQNINRKIAVLLLFIMLIDIVTPTLTFALTGGPAAPEFSSFEPVTTTNLVNEFTGDFTYNIPVINIPGANDGGYALSLSYHSGETVESEASWVGYGWTLNPGAITRGKKGFADDTKNTHTFYNDVPKNWTVSVGGMVGNFEAYSFDVPVSLNTAIRYNNYRGFGYTAGVGVSVRQGLVTLGYSISDGSGSFSAQVNPAALLSSSKNENEKETGKAKASNKELKDGCPDEAKKTKEEARAEKKKNQNSGKAFANAALSRLGQSLSSYGMYALGDQQHPTSVTEYHGFAVNIHFNGQADPAPLQLGLQFGGDGNYNQQVNTPESNRIGYGYLYSSDAYADNSGVMDYSVEKEAMFNKRDRYLSIPYSAPDGFAVSGEGLGGGFKLHSRYPGHFRPNSISSVTDIAQLAGSIHLGLHYGLGFTGGYGQQKLTVDGNEWGDAGYGNTLTYRFLPKNMGDEAYFLRFDGDLGGDVLIGDNSIAAATLNENSGIQGLKSYSPNIGFNTSFSSVIYNNTGSSTARSGRSSFINYHTNQEILSSGNTPFIYERSGSIVTNTAVNRAANPEHIGEIATVNEEGNTYVYGLPVYVKNETSLSYDLKGAVAGDIDNNFIAYKNNLSDYTFKVGNVDNGGYANSYLLTQITTPDYVDRTLNGPTGDDFGGYTKFEYEQVYNAAEANPYHFRIPYSGLTYNRQALADCYDDMGSFISGDKDVYYLKQIVTKTHTAIFITDDRKDGYDANHDNNQASRSAKGSNPLKKLTEIQLWANATGSTPAKLIKKVLFKYDYSICKGVINNLGGNTSDPNTTGKLTLKEIWFEYEGIVKAKISPYQFEYEYPTSATSPYPQKYAALQSQFGDAGLFNNPPYSPFAVDAWGNYQDAATGQARFAQLKTMVNQTPPPSFDPAAWQLKVIKLPSGGEIHVQYEQDEYLYVQDRRACSLVSLLATSSGDNVNPANSTTYATESVFALNVADIGVSSTTDKQDLVALIKQNLNDEKIYFKFLYALVGHNPAINMANSEYITGYVNFLDAYLSSSGKVIIAIGDASNGQYALPHDVCIDLVRKQKGGKLNANGSCDPSEEGIQDGPSAKDVVMQLLNKIGTSFFAQSTSCLEYNNSLSYFKIPVLKAKKGGGLRVKRILMYDKNGVDAGVAALYGTEYIYKTETNESSGVTTNEPVTIREENPWVTFLPKRAEQEWYSKVVAGNDKDQFEGLMGESVLPSPSVGYSRVVAKNIHSGKTNTGIVVSTFNTCKDYPLDRIYIYADGSPSGISNSVMEVEKDWMQIPAVVVNYSVTNIWATQGYRFILNNMNGKPKTVETYAGDYDDSNNLQSFYMSSSTKYEYFAPGESLQMMAPDGSIYSSIPGKESEMTFEMKQVEDVTEDGSIEYDAGIGLALAIPIPSFAFLPTYSYTESKMRTHTTSKVINFPAIQKSVTSVKDGIENKTENLVFSAYTGKPIITRSYDGHDNLNLPIGGIHDGSYTSHTIPAYSQYKEFGQKASAEGLLVNLSNISVSYNNSGVETLNFVGNASNSVCDAMGALTKGDLVLINGSYYYYIDEAVGNTITILPAQLVSSGTVSGSSVSSIKIIKTGRSNRLNTQAGNFVTYGTPLSQINNVNPIDNVQGSLRQTFASHLTNLIATGGTISSSTMINEYSNLKFNLNNECRNFMGVINVSNDEFYIYVKFLEYDNSIDKLVELCSTRFKKSGGNGHFDVDLNTGELVYYTADNPCIPIMPLGCFQFCPTLSKTINKVVASGATTFDCNWPYDASLYGGAGIGNAYETGAKGKWRPKENFVFKTKAKPGVNASANERNYADAGTYTLNVFNWKQVDYNLANNWIKTSTVTKYSPNGEAIEEVDALGVYSSAKFGYKGSVPYLVAQNSSNNFVAFESFENLYSNNTFEDGVAANPTQHITSTAHAGGASYSLSGTDYFRFNPFTLTTAQQRAQGLSIKLWVKDMNMPRTAYPVKGQLLSSNPVVLVFSKVAQSGQWSLFEAKIQPNTLTLNTSYQLQVQSNAAGSIYIDDIRQQPLDAQMNTYVYEPATLKMLASFDDQNFGLYYQYNAEGKLVRKITETEKGMKTIIETQYNTPRVTRNTSLE